MNADPKTTLDEVEAWWALIARILSFFGGGIVLAYTAIYSVAETPEKMIFAAVAVGMMGQVVIAGVAQAFAVFRGGVRRE